MCLAASESLSREGDRDDACENRDADQPRGLDSDVPRIGRRIWSSGTRWASAGQFGVGPHDRPGSTNASHRSQMTSKVLEGQLQKRCGVDAEEAMVGPRHDHELGRSADREVPLVQQATLLGGDE